MARQAVINIKPEKVPILTPAIRAVKIINMVKSFLEIHSVNGPRVPSRDKIMMTGLSFYQQGSYEKCPANFIKPILSEYSQSFTHKLPMRTDECLSALTQDVAEFEQGIDRTFLDILLDARAPQVFAGTEDEAYQMAVAKLEAVGHPVNRILVRDGGEMHHPVKEIVPSSWPFPLLDFVVGSVPSMIGVMETSPMGVDLWVEKMAGGELEIRLKLVKTLGFIVDPQLIVSCQVREPKES